jgi:hypothetical protein
MNTNTLAIISIMGAFIIGLIILDMFLSSIHSMVKILEKEVSKNLIEGKNFERR